MSKEGLKWRPTATPHPESRGRQARRLIEAGILAIATLLGYAILIPRMSVTVSDPPDPNDPFSSSVTVTNTGFLTLDSVLYCVAINKIEQSGISLDGGSYSGVLMPDESFHHPQNLESDNPISFPLNEVLVADKGSLTGADIGILIEYQIPIIHWERYKLFPVALKKQSNGNFYWYAKAPPQDVGKMSYYLISVPIKLPLRPSLPAN